MDDKNRKNNLAGGVDVLIEAIEGLGNIKVDLNAPSEPIDIVQMRKHEAYLASQEIAASKIAKRRNYVDKLHNQGAVNPLWTFSNLTKDSANQKALTTAQGFCMSLDITDNEPLLFLVSGGPGTGKTCLCHAVANSVLEKSSSRHIFIVNYDNLKKTRLFMAHENSDVTAEKQQEWERYCSVDLLLLDGLCANNEGLTVFDQKILSELLRIRFVKGLDMMITTPVNFMQLHQAIGDTCFESIREYSVISAMILGQSRRRPLIVDGVPIP